MHSPITTVTVVSDVASTQILHETFNENLTWNEAGIIISLNGGSKRSIIRYCRIRYLSSMTMKTLCRFSI